MHTVANHPNRSKQNRSVAANPTPAEIVPAREAAELTQTEAGELLFTGWRTWQNWELGVNRMPPAAWELFNVKVRAKKLLERGEIEPELLRALGLHLPKTGK